jgi:hypothetical protein
MRVWDLLCMITWCRMRKLLFIASCFANALLALMVIFLLLMWFAKDLVWVLGRVLAS